MTDAIGAAYEAVPYDSRPITPAHIDALATVARLHGLSPADPTHCRVLELGCASAGNLVPMALEYPQSRFVGVDLAPGQIAAGAAVVAALGIENLSLHSASIADIGDAFGEFDFVICHGVYSWVPGHVQDAILRVCSRNLARGGVAYVSYNTYPGWHVRMMVRQMILTQDDPQLPPTERVSRARAFLERLAAEVAAPATLHTAVLRDEIAVVRGQADFHFLHEQLEPFNAPVLFSEFAGRAAQHGLRYLSEATIADARAVATNATPPDGSEDEIIRAEQYDDFIRGGTFRRTLLCHSGEDVRRGAGATAIPGLYLTMRAERVTPDADDLPPALGVESFRSADGVTVSTSHPLIVAGLHALEQSAPRALRFANLVEAVRARQGTLKTANADSEAEAGELADAMLQCAKVGLIALRSSPISCARRVSDRPVASPLALWQAQRSGVVSNLRHGTVELPAVARFLLVHLDGRHDRAQLLAKLEAALLDAQIVVDGATPDRRQLEALIDDVLRYLL
ncbi:MAG TPA: methyltransferase regulatory domain-containing protein, partial [Gemmatimonadaceae bacterium]